MEGAVLTFDVKHPSSFSSTIQQKNLSFISPCPAEELYSPAAFKDVKTQKRAPGDYTRTGLSRDRTVVAVPLAAASLCIISVVVCFELKVAFSPRIIGGATAQPAAACNLHKFQALPLEPGNRKCSFSREYIIKRRRGKSREFF